MVTEILKQEIDALREQLLLLEHRAQQLRAMLSEYEQELNAKVAEAKEEEAQANNASTEALAKATEAQRVAISAMVAAKTAQESLQDILKQQAECGKEVEQEIHQGVKQDVSQDTNQEHSQAPQESTAPTIELYTPKDEDIVVGEPELEEPIIDTIDNIETPIEGDGQDDYQDDIETTDDEPQFDIQDEESEPVTISDETEQEEKEDDNTAKQPWYGEIETETDNSTVGSTFLPPVSNIRDAISLGDRFLFQRELFNADGEKMQKTLDDLNRLKSFEDAMHYLNKHFKWNTESQAYKLFIGVLKRRF